MAEVIPRKTVQVWSCKPEPIYRKTAPLSIPEQQASVPIESLPNSGLKLPSYGTQTSGLVRAYHPVYTSVSR